MNAFHGCRSDFAQTTVKALWLASGELTQPYYVQTE